MSQNQCLFFFFFFFYLSSWLVADCHHGMRVVQLAWRGFWNSVPTQDQSLKWKILRGGLGRVVGPPELYPEAWVPERALAPSHPDNNGWSYASEHSPWSWFGLDTSPWFSFTKWHQFNLDTPVAISFFKSGCLQIASSFLFSCCLSLLLNAASCLSITSVSEKQLKQTVSQTESKWKTRLRNAVHLCHLCHSSHHFLPAVGPHDPWQQELFSGWDIITSSNTRVDRATGQNTGGLFITVALLACNIPACTQCWRQEEA